LVYRLDGGGRAIVPADAVEAVGDEWSLIYWDPKSGQYLDSIDDLVVHDTDRPPNLSDSLSGAET
jgi:hypothetical protein